MDLYELARTVQADKNRAIEAESRRRHLLEQSDDTAAAATTVKTPSRRPVQPSPSTTAVSR
jgi:hypothetical protein